MSISIEQLSFAYSRTPVLRNVSLHATPGTITALLGPNASGKSTLLKCIVGALRPQSGSVRVHGKSVHQMSSRKLAQHVAYVPQRSVVSSTFTVRQVIELGRYALPANPARIDQSIQQLDLGDIADRPFRELSVGQQQRVTIARALAQLYSDGCLLMDEPTSAMDLHHLADCMELLSMLASNGATIVIAMHDLSTAAAIADRIWLLQDGSVVGSGSTHDMLQPHILQSVYNVDFEWASTSQQPRLLPQITHRTQKPTVPTVGRDGGGGEEERL